MTDSELLELAAKAIGLSLQLALGPTAGDSVFFTPDGKAWDPLANDGDALRLAVQIGFYIDIERPCGQVDVGPWRAIERFQFDDLDAALVATRRAIVRAAADIGRAMC